MNTPPTNPENPENPENSENAAWEEAMSRDFDARVRDLHEAPLDMSSVKGKAHKIRRNRRAAVAGSILGVAAIVTPVAVLMDGGDPGSQKPDFAPEPTETASDPAGGTDYLQGGTWHQADGDEVTLPETAEPYTAAVLWNDQLVATRWDGEVYSVADVIDEEGEVVESFPVAETVVVNGDGTTIAWVDPDGSVKTRWDDGRADVGTVDMAAPGETVAWSAAAVVGGPECSAESDGCLVYLNNLLGEAPVTVPSQGNDNPVPEALSYSDVSEDRTAAILTRLNDDASVCSGIADPQTGAVRETCDFLVEDISPDGSRVAAVESYQSGPGPASISVLDVATLTETGRYAPEGGHIGTWAWDTDGNLVFDAYDGAQWHLFTMTPGGKTSEIGEPVKGPDFDSPFVLIRH